MKKILSFNEIDIVAKKLANTLEENSVVALIGDIGTGKTSFVKTFAKELSNQMKLLKIVFLLIDLL